MFDNSYECEASIEASRRLKERSWRIILNSNCLNSNVNVMVESFNINYYNEVILYNLIMLETHGGY